MWVINSVERCIGVINSRFRCLLKHQLLECTPIKSGLIVNSCVTFHYMCKEAGNPLPEKADYYGDSSSCRVPNEQKRHIKLGQNYYTSKQVTLCIGKLQSDTQPLLLLVVKPRFSTLKLIMGSLVERTPSSCHQPHQNGLI